MANTHKKKKRLDLPFPVLLIVLGMMFPADISPNINGFHIFMHRLAILIFFFPAVGKLRRAKDARFQNYDFLFLAYTLWMLTTYMIHMGFQPGLKYGGSLAVECFGAYVVARAYVRSYAHFKAVVSMLVLSVSVLGLLAWPEALTGKRYLHICLPSLGCSIKPLPDEMRWGLHRADATFEHPILYASFCASVLGMAWCVEKRSYLKVGKALAITGATFLGLSSAPLNMLGLQVGLGALHKITLKIPNRMVYFWMAFAALYAFLSVVSNDTPMGIIARHLTIDQQTGYYRTLIWTYGMQNVWANPIFGLGLGHWARPKWMPLDTVDTYWLLTTMQQGIPAIIFLVAAITTLLRSAYRHRGKKLTGEEKRASVGWSISIAALMINAFTVHYWDAMHAYLFMLFGMGGWLADPAKLKAKAKAKAPAAIAPVEPRVPALGWPEPLPA